MPLMYDSTQPLMIPNSANFVALYANGMFEYKGKEKPEWTRILWIDVNGSVPTEASILDIETGDATPGQVPGWCAARLKAVPDSMLRLYCNLSTWPAVKGAVSSMPAKVRSRVRYWIANPTGTAHIVPGSSATQWHWTANYDASSYNDSW